MPVQWRNEAEPANTKDCRHVFVDGECYAVWWFVGGERRGLYVSWNDGGRDASVLIPWQHVKLGEQIPGVQIIGNKGRIFIVDFVKVCLQDTWVWFPQKVIEEAVLPNYREFVLQTHLAYYQEHSTAAWLNASAPSPVTSKDGPGPFPAQFRIISDGGVWVRAGIEEDSCPVEILQPHMEFIALGSQCSTSGTLSLHLEEPYAGWVSFRPASMQRVDAASKGRPSQNSSAK